jgi:acid phosphatase family membrane protein YuiD
MYDATGVRLHAGRQAEVSSLLGGSVIDLLYLSPLRYIHTTLISFVAFCHIAVA